MRTNATRVLEPMRVWIQSTVRSNRFFKDQEVIDQLNLYSPRHDCAIIFARMVLLPAVKLHAQISERDLIVHIADLRWPLVLISQHLVFLKDGRSEEERYL
jgi:hypothetical protein